MRSSAPRSGSEASTPSPPTGLSRRRNNGGGGGAVCHVLSYIAQGQRGHRLACPCRGAAHMRQHGNVVQLAELVRHNRFVGNHVEPGTGAPSVGPPLHESFLVNDATSCE